MLQRRRFSSYVARVVCRNCNHGWMNDRVESPAIPILKPMFLPLAGPIRPRPFKVAEQRAMATWAFKVALLLPYKYIPPRDEAPWRIAAFYRFKRPPRGTYVWLGARGRGGAFPYMEAIHVYSDAPRKAKALHEESEFVTFALGHVVFRVLKGPRRLFYPGVSPEPRWGRWTRLWPSSGRNVIWPRAEFSFDELRREAAGIFTPPL